jgi:hypothetical protein
VAAGNLDQLRTGIDRLDAKAALDESPGQLAGAAADLDDLRATIQAADGAGGFDERRRIARPNSVVLLGHLIEDET